MKKQRQQSRPTEKKSTGASAPDSALLLRSGMLFAALAIVRLVAAQFPEARLWGLSYAAYLPEWAMYAGTALGLLFATRAVYPLFGMKAVWIGKYFGIGLTAVAALACGALFWFFRMDTYFLGDGAVYLAEHFRLVRGMPVSDTVLYSLLSAPLTGYLLSLVSKFSWAVSSGEGMLGNPQAAWWLSGAAAGVAYAAIVFSGMRRFSADGAVRLAGMAILLLTPGVLFFFGYVEYYTLLLAVGTAYFLASDRSARGEVPVWVPGMLLLLAAALHFMALLLLPGFLLLLYSRRSTDGSSRMTPLRALAIGAGASLIAGGIWYFASGTAFEGSRVILSLVPFGEEGAMQQYTLLHPAHLLDVVNILLLLGGPLLAALPFLRLRNMDNASLVALAHVLFTGFLLLFGYTGFGMARDWDVNALFGVALAIFTLTLLRASADATRRSWLAYLISGAVIVGTLPWLAVNIGTDSSVGRFRHIMALDDELLPGDFALNGYEHLRKFYQSTGDNAGVAWAIERKIDMVGYPDDFRKYVLAAVTSMSGSEREGAFARTFGGILQRLRQMQTAGVDSLYEGDRQSFEEVYAETLMQADYLSLARAMNPAIAQSYLDSLRAVDSDGGTVILIEALMLEARGQAPASIEAFSSAAHALHGSSTLAAYAGRVLLTAGRIDDAVGVLREAIRLDEQFTLPSLYLGQALLRLDPPDAAGAVAQLRRFIDTPGGHRIGDPRAQQQLMDAAQRLLQQIEMDG